MSSIKVAKKQYKFLQACKMLRFIYLYGGAGSAKSWQIALFLLLEKMYKEPGCGILILRKTKPAVRISCVKLIYYWLNTLGLPYKSNLSDMTITAPNGSFIKFDSLDDVEKKKSIEGINYIWLEETTELIEKEVVQLNLRCRANNPYGVNQIYCSFNPVDAILNAWLKSLSDNASTCVDVNGKRNSAALRVTHKDNPFLPEEERNQIEALAGQDAEYDAIYRKGEWATPTNIIYDRWDIVPNFPQHYDSMGYGLDFGFTNPTALIKVAVCDVQDIYLQEVIYESSLTNPDIIALMQSNGITTETIIADSAQPDKIKEIENAGFDIYPCVKGAGSVTHGLDCCKRKKLHIVQGSENLLNEIRSYKHKVTKQGEVLEDPLTYKDHAMDAMRYYLSAFEDIEEIELITLGEYQLT